MSGFEALVRWRHPHEGLLEPGAFLEFAEQADLTERIGEVVLTQSLAALTAWDAAGLAVPRVGVNFAMAQLRDPRLIEKIKWEVERNDVEPARIAIEVLETVLIKSDDDVVVRNLRGPAPRAASRSSSTTSAPATRRSRTCAASWSTASRSTAASSSGSRPRDEQQTLTSSMIAMARALGIATLAEGVETPRPPGC